MTEIYKERPIEKIIEIPVQKVVEIPIEKTIEKPIYIDRIREIPIE